MREKLARHQISLFIEKCCRPAISNCVGHRFALFLASLRSAVPPGQCEGNGKNLFGAALALVFISILLLSFPVVADTPAPEKKTAEPLQSFQIEKNPKPESLVKWAGEKLAEANKKTDTSDLLARALVARCGDDGKISVSMVPLKSDAGMAWPSGKGGNWDIVRRVPMRSGGIERPMIWAHPVERSTLMIALPKVPAGEPLRFTYGLADSALGNKEGGDVDLQVFADGKEIFKAVQPNQAGWKDRKLDLRAVSKKPEVDVVVLVRTAKQAARHFGFNMMRWKTKDALPNVSPVSLTKTHTLRASIAELEVYRAFPDGTILEPAVFDKGVMRAASLHEPEDVADEAWLQNQWQFSPNRLPWDTVAQTKQRSGGVSREGLWAHPRMSSVLTINVPVAKVGKKLAGFCGFTDTSLNNMIPAGETTPVELRVLMDGKEILSFEAPKTHGWKELSAEIPKGKNPRKLSVEIRSQKDHWEHFIFDLWSE